MPTPIYYAPPRPWYRSNRAQRTLIRLLILAAITCAAVWAFRVVQQLLFLFQQHRWMQYSMPANKVLLAEDTPDVSLLQTTTGYHNAALDFPPLKAVACDPPTDIAPLPWAAKSTVIFLHKMRAGLHHDRLVSVTVEPPHSTPSTSPVTGFGGIERWDYGGEFGRLVALAQTLADLRPGGRPIPCSPFGRSGELDVPGAPVRIFAGQTDPADESHFTIRYELDGKANTIDGWLMPDDTVKLEPRM